MALCLAGSDPDTTYNCAFQRRLTGTILMLRCPGLTKLPYRPSSGHLSLRTECTSRARICSTDAMPMPAHKRFANPNVSRAVANLVRLGLERSTQIGVAFAISGVLTRHFAPDLFGKWQYASTLCSSCRRLHGSAARRFSCRPSCIVRPTSSAPCSAARSCCGFQDRFSRCC